MVSDVAYARQYARASFSARLRHFRAPPRLLDKHDVGEGGQVEGDDHGPVDLLTPCLAQRTARARRGTVGEAVVGWIGRRGGRVVGWGRWSGGRFPRRSRTCEKQKLKHVVTTNITLQNKEKNQHFVFTPPTRTWARNSPTRGTNKQWTKTRKWKCSGTNTWH